MIVGRTEDKEKSLLHTSTTEHADRGNNREGRAIDAISLRDLKPAPKRAENGGQCPGNQSCRGSVSVANVPNLYVSLGVYFGLKNFRNSSVALLTPPWATSLAPANYLNAYDISRNSTYLK